MDQNKKPTDASQQATPQEVENDKVTTERDAMMEMIKAFSAQISVFLEKEEAPKSETTSLTPVAFASDAEKLRQTNRQIEELTRRITALETIQRNSASDLNREREARLKAEKLLANAERVQVDTAAHIDAIKAAIRKEVEAAAHTREKELSRSKKEIQEQLMYLQDEHRRTLASLEAARR